MAISVIQQWIALAAGTTSIDATGSDCLVVGNIGTDTSFTTGKAVPTVLTYAGVDILTNYTYRFLGTGPATDGYAIWVLVAPASGSNNLVITNQGGSYGLGPRAIYALFSGVDQTTPVRSGSVLEDASLGTSVSFTPTGLTSGDLLNVITGDFADTAHTATGSGTLVLDSAAITSGSMQVNQFTATGSSHTMGVGSGSNIWGAVFPFIAATGGGGGSPTLTQIEHARLRGACRGMGRGLR